MTEHEFDETTWEGFCKKCGLCCFEKIEGDNGTIFFTSTPCRYLDITTRECKVYDRRFKINPDCIKLTVELVSELHWLHERCGYREACGVLPTRRNPNKKS